MVMTSQHLHTKSCITGLFACWTLIGVFFLNHQLLCLHWRCCCIMCRFSESDLNIIITSAEWSLSLLLLSDGILNALALIISTTARETDRRGGVPSLWTSAQRERARSVIYSVFNSTLAYSTTHTISAVCSVYNICMIYYIECAV